MFEDVLRSIDARRQQSVADLKEFLRIPSVSTKPEHEPDMRRCADWLAAKPRRAELHDAWPWRGTEEAVARARRHWAPPLARPWEQRRLCRRAGPTPWRHRSSRRLKACNRRRRPTLLTSSLPTNFQKFVSFMPFSIFKRPKAI